MLALNHIRFILILIFATYVIEIKAFDSPDGGSSHPLDTNRPDDADQPDVVQPDAIQPDQSDENQPVDHSMEIELDPNDEIILDVVKMMKALEEPCSEEGLELFMKANENYESYLELDAGLPVKAQRYKAKCLLTFIANVFPFWSKMNSRETLKDWEDIASEKAENIDVKYLRKRYDNVAFVHAYQSYLDVNLDQIFKESLMFINNENPSTSEDTTKKIDAAKAAFATGKNGYCWPMQSETFVRVNTLIELYLAVFYEEDMDSRNQLFSNLFLRKTFNLYSICKSILRGIIGINLNSDIDTSLPNSLKPFIELPMTYISLEDADFATGYLESLTKVTNECTPRTLISFTATQETIQYADNEQLQEYLQYETDFAKIMVVLTCKQEVKPRYKYEIWFARHDCALSILYESVYRVARDINVIDILKAGNVGQLSHLLGSEETHSLILKQIRGEAHPEELIGLSNKIYEKSSVELSTLCEDFNFVYKNKNQYFESLSYLIHHYSQYSMVEQILTEQNSDVMKYFLTFVLCQNLSPATSSSASS